VKNREIRVSPGLCRLVGGRKTGFQVGVTATLNEEDVISDHLV
jgi:hypothetical protein